MIFYQNNNITISLKFNQVLLHKDFEFLVFLAVSINKSQFFQQFVIQTLNLTKL